MHSKYQNQTIFDQFNESTWMLINEVQVYLFEAPNIEEGERLKAFSIACWFYLKNSLIAWIEYLMTHPHRHMHVKHPVIFENHWILQNKQSFYHFSAPWPYIFHTRCKQTILLSYTYFYLISYNILLETTKWSKCSWP